MPELETSRQGGRRPFVAALAALAFLAAAAFGAASPNVILILADDQGYGDFGCHGNKDIRTPGLDQLHAESIRLTDFHVDPTCAPTRAALMTGRYASRTGVWLTYGGRHRLRADEVTMAEVFAKNGYRTAIFGKWHLGDNYPFRPHDRGFEESLIHGGGVIGETPDHWGNDYYDDTYFRNGVPEKASGYCTDVWFGEALRFIQKTKDEEKPFFIYLPTNAPHGPFNVPAEYVKPYLDAGVPPDRARFYGMIGCIDENVDRLRERLREGGLEKDTILIYMTDNGTSAGVMLEGGEHGWEDGGFNAGMRGKKGSPYDGGHRAACFVHWPAGGLTGGRDISRLTVHMDLFPTLLSLCGLPSPEGVVFDGHSLKSLFEDDSPDAWPQRTFVVHHQGRVGEAMTDDRPIKGKDYAVMFERWRLVGDELYHLERDPGQRIDIGPRSMALFAMLKNAYEHWWQAISPRFGEYCRTIVGSEHQERTVLTAQEWHGGPVPYNQQHVRAAMEANGFWDIEVARAGEYEIVLRRWPEELDLPIRATVPAPRLDPANFDVEAKLYQLPSGPIAAKTARLKAGDFDETCDVKPDDKAIRFRVKLAQGAVDLETWFTDEAGKTWGAYYVTVERVGDG